MIPFNRLFHWNNAIRDNRTNRLSRHGSWHYAYPLKVLLTDTLQLSSFSASGGMCQDWNWKLQKRLPRTAAELLRINAHRCTPNCHLSRWLPLSSHSQLLTPGHVVLYSGLCGSLHSYLLSCRRLLQALRPTRFPTLLFAKSPPPHLAHPTKYHHPFSIDNYTANSSCTAVKFEMQPDQSLATTMVGSMSFRIHITLTTVANFLLRSARSTFLLFLTLASLIWTLRACN